MWTPPSRGSGVWGVWGVWGVRDPVAALVTLTAGLRRSTWCGTLAQVVVPRAVRDRCPIAGFHGRVREGPGHRGARAGIGESPHSGSWF